MNDTFIYIQEFDNGSIRYGITNNLDRRMNEHRITYGDTFTWSLMVDRPVKLSTAKTIEALLIQQAFDAGTDCINNHVENKRYLFENKAKLDSCPICEEIGCSIDAGYIDKLILEHKDKRAEQKKAYRTANKDKIAERNKAYYVANKDKRAEQDKAYYLANKEKRTEQDKAYYVANKEQILEQKKAYYAANKEIIAEQKKAYRTANKEKIAEQNKAYRAANKEIIVEQGKAYYVANKDKIAEYKKAWRAAKREEWNTKAIEAGYKDRFECAKILKMNQKIIDWDNLPRR